MHKVLFIAMTTAFIISGVGFSSGSAQTPAPRATTQGGSHQINALQGCMNQWLFNGVWRIRVTQMSSITDSTGMLPGVRLSFEVRNGSKTETMLLKTAVPSNPGSLIFDDSNELDGTNTDAIVAWNAVYFKSLPPSGAMAFSIPFIFQPAPAKVPKPVKWLLNIDASKEWAGAPRYSTSNPSLRVDLTCNKATQ